MAKISEYFDFADKDKMTIERLLTELERMYFDLAVAINAKPDVYFRDTDGQTTDTFLSNGDMTVNENTRKVEMLTEHSSTTAVVWTLLS